MNAIVADVLARETKKIESDPHPLVMIAMFCGIGLVVSIALIAIGFDLGAGLF